MKRKLWLLCVGLLLLLYAGCTLRGAGDVEARAARVPRMTCDELLRDGPRGHTHVTLTDVKLCRGPTLFYRDGLSPGHVEETVPVYSAKRQREPAARELRLVLQVFDDEQRQRIIRQPEPGEVTCEVRRAPGWLDPADVTALESAYPGLKVGRCWVLGVGLHEPTEARAHQMKRDATFAAGLGMVALAGLGLWLLIERRRRPRPASPPAGAEPTLTSPSTG